MNLKYLRFLANKIVKMDSSMLLIDLDVVSIVITVDQYSIPCIMLVEFVIYDAIKGPLCGFAVFPEEGRTIYHLSITKPWISFLMFS
jgi:hypothetical protein